MHFAAGPPVIDHTGNNEEITDECWWQNPSYGRRRTWQSGESSGALEWGQMAAHHDVDDERTCDGRIKEDGRR
jgi:hypothetical protein